MPRKSQRVGPTTDSEGAQTMAYRACQPFVCAQCGGAIYGGPFCQVLRHFWC